MVSRKELFVDARRVLLTGGAGFIGSHLAESFLGRGVNLTIVDNLDDFYSPAWKRANLEHLRSIGSFRFLEIDIRDRKGIRDAFAAVTPDVVVHLAARAGVRPSIENPCLYQEVNIAGTLNLLEACRELKVRNFVFGSSSSVYGATSRVPFSEDQVEMRPISPYAATKLAGEMLSYTYSHLYEISVAGLRFLRSTARGKGQIWQSTSFLHSLKKASRYLSLVTEPMAVTIPMLTTSFRVLRQLSTISSRETNRVLRSLI